MAVVDFGENYCDDYCFVDTGCPGAYYVVGVPRSSCLLGCMRSVGLGC